ncbi:hypothetical protein [Flavobacterium ustbae]|uniref:hypothetical protein n=1 Tax=Flavobacterium ustbae TaxID=2488790 RepID=UPI000F7AB43B|nr:hypothetical protein [Flavobacterium ustbae]
MINLFKQKTRAKDIALLELKIAELIAPEFPKIKDCLWKGGLKIDFSNIGILIDWKSYILKEGEDVIRCKPNYFELSGVYLVEKNSQELKEIKLIYQSNRLREIKVENPKTFHKDFDFNSLIKKDLKTRNIEVDNPDARIVAKILEALSKEQKGFLELEDTFEIEIDEKFYYTILDMEDGNYIAIDKKGKVYRLIHDHKESAKQIAVNSSEFLKNYKGIKSDLNIYFV